MDNNKAYRIVSCGKKSSRRDYSKVSGKLELPNLVEIQTDSFKWFTQQGIQEVFEEIYPIENYGKNIRLNFLRYHFEEPKYNAEESMYRECNFAAPLYADMELEVTDSETGEVVTKSEEVYLGDFPLMTETGTFIINGAERVIVSQIVRSPGAYFADSYDKKTGKQNFSCELIPSRGTWLEFMTEQKKTTNGRLINVSIDRRRKVLFSILFKAIGMSLNIGVNEDTHDTSMMETFLRAMGRNWSDVATDAEDREYMNMYLLLYTAFFGKYEEIENSLLDDKVKTTQEALLSFYENQRSDEIPTLDGSITLMQAKFFDHRRYDLTKAGRYKLRKKLNAIDRMYGMSLAHDIVDVNGNVFMEKGTMVHRDERNALREELAKGTYCVAYPFRSEFHEEDIVSIPTSWTTGLIGRVLASDVETEDAYLDAGTVLTEQDVLAIQKVVENVEIFAGLFAQQVKLTAENMDSVFNYGQRLYALGRLTNAQGEDIVDADMELVANRYMVGVSPDAIDSDVETQVKQRALSEDITAWLIGACVQEVYIIDNNGDEVRVAGNDPFANKHTITVSDMYAFFSYSLNVMEGVGTTDDIDMLGNRRIRSVGELIQNQFRIGLSRMERVVKERMSIQEMDSLTPRKLTNIRPLTAAIKEFFSSSQLSQFMDQQNPLAELTNKRRISALGPGGISRDRASFEVRDVHNSHYGRICPIETPEGPNIGLINSLACYARINEYGFVEAPYRKIDKSDKDNPRVTDEVVYMTADEEDNYHVAQANEKLDEDGHFVRNSVSGRYREETQEYDKTAFDYMDVSPKMVFSVATALIPFLQNDDANRALMGSNMQRQAVPLMVTQQPIVATGMEYKAATDSGTAVLAKNDGIVEKMDADHVTVRNAQGGVDNYPLVKFARSNAGTCINQRPIVEVGESVKAGQVLADGPAMRNGEISLGKNALIGFMTWEGYNYEDAVLLNEKIVREDVYTSIHIEEYETESRDTKLGPEEITRDIPNVSEDALKDLDERGIIRIGAEVKSGDILVGKVTPKGETELTAEERLLRAIFGEKAREVRDTSLRVPHGAYGIIVDVKVFTPENSDELQPGVREVVRCYIAQKRKISVGDKMAGRHGNKGVVSRILPQEDMPYLPDGTPLDIVLNPLGVPSRMNIGQVLEVNLGYAAKACGIKVMTPVFDSARENDIGDTFDTARELWHGENAPAYPTKLPKIMGEKGHIIDFSKIELDRDGKTTVYDGRTGEKFDNRVTVGYMYYLKLHHLVDDKIHARSTGPYSLVTQQPLGGKAQFGGQRFGEMEVWALEAYGAAYTLQEILTVKSDDVEGRVKTYEAIVKGEPIPQPGIPESFRVMLKELQSLGMDVVVQDKDGNEIDMRQNFDDEETGFDMRDVAGSETVTNENELLNDYTIKDADAGFDDPSVLEDDNSGSAAPASDEVDF